MMPYIDACLALAPASRWVSFAGEDGSDGVLVRLSGEGGGFDCAARAGAPETAKVVPRDEQRRVAAENGALFVRAPGANPGGECYDALEVRGGDGALLGWMADPGGC